MATLVILHSSNQSAKASKSAVKVPKGRTFFSVRPAGTQAQCSRDPMSIPAALGLINSQPWSMSIFVFVFFALLTLFFMCCLWLRPKSGRKNCNLSNRITPQAAQSLRSFTNGSAENLGTKLLNGHVSAIVEPAIARRNHPEICHQTRNKR